jgi:hypothetical protein
LSRKKQFLYTIESDVKKFIDSNLFWTADFAIRPAPARLP